VFNFDECWMRVWHVSPEEHSVDLGCPTDLEEPISERDKIVDAALKGIPENTPRPIFDQRSLWWFARKTKSEEIYEGILEVTEIDGRLDVVYHFHRGSAATPFSHERKLLAEGCPQWVSDSLRGCISNGGYSSDDQFCEGIMHEFVEAFRGHLWKCDSVYAMPYFEPGDESLAILPVE
jgi:hypothetical protein